MNKEICIITCHGFTGYPEEMNPLGAYLQTKGYVWKNLQLPGHGTTPEDLKDKTWRDWTSYVLNEVDKSLKKYNNQVVMAGLSLGGILTLYTLINRPQLKAGVVLATPVNAIGFFQGLFLKIPFLDK